MAGVGEDALGAKPQGACATEEADALVWVVETDIGQWLRQKSLLDRRLDGEVGVRVVGWTWGSGCKGL